jgi:aminoglycoside phosphotransferase (APT) family kinase protein
VLDVDLAWIARETGASRARVAERVQSLWGGHGEIVRVALDDCDLPSVIVKYVRMARTRDSSESYERKRRSYAVEDAWYAGVAKRCDAACRVPQLLARRACGDERLFVLEDLDAAGFAGRTHRPNGRQLVACLGWLAAFHARFLGVASDGLWKTGTYWHLATRRQEARGIDDEVVRDLAPRLDAALEACVFRTLVHGDAKPANFCFSRSGAVAAVDFQYVGGGCGMRDVAYLLDGEDEEARLLDLYFARLRVALGTPSASRQALGTPSASRQALGTPSASRQALGPTPGDALEAEWRRLYPIAAADYQRFLAGWGKYRWRRDGRADAIIARAVRSLGAAAP